MEILKPEMIALIVGVVGFTEGVKSMGLRLPTVVISLLLSVLAGIVSASPLTWQTAGIATITIYGIATLAYEAVLKRVEGLWEQKLK
jgi:hypothetical protein